MYDYAPELMAACRARGDEIVGHGRTNAERQSALDEAAERTLIAEATASIAAHEGYPPKGWLSPWIAESHNTPGLLAAAGYRYTLNGCMDDQPVRLRTRHGPILAIPAIVARRTSAADFAAMIIDTFDEMLEQSRD